MFNEEYKAPVHIVITDEKFAAEIIAACEAYAKELRDLEDAVDFTVTDAYIDSKEQGRL